MRPACCSPPAAFWPWAEALPGLALSHCSFDPVLFDPADPQRCGLILPERLRSAAAKRQSEFLAGRLCAAKSISLLGLPPQYPSRGEQGGPQWPQGLCGSITHSHGHALAIVGDSACWQGLGLDAEQLIAPARAQRLAGQILVADEQQRFDALWAVCPVQAAQFLTLVFSAKESLFKALHPLVGQRFHFPAACLLPASEDGCLQLELRQSLGAAWPAGALLCGRSAMRDGWLLSLITIAA